MNDSEDVLRRVDKMLEAGRISEEDAARVRAAAVSGNVDDVVNEIRSKHMRERIASAVEDGRLTAEEAGVALGSIDAGEGPHALGDLRRGLRRP